MSSSPKTIFQQPGSTRNFLLSKTDTGRSRDVARKKAVGVLEMLQSVYPDLLGGRSFLDLAMQRLGSEDRFAALAVGVDQIQPEREEYSNPVALDEHMEVAATLESVCREAKGWWGILESGLFGCIFPQKNDREGLRTARRIQERLALKTKQTVTIGIAAYPSISYKKNDIIDNARKAVDHAAFFGPGSVTAFDGVSLNISGDKLYENGDLQEAVDEFERALLLEPSNVNVHNSLGVCYGLQGAYESAIKEFEAVLSLEPDDYMALYNLGLINALQKEPDKALEFFLKADRINSNVYEVAFQSGKLYIESGQPKKAKPFLERAAALDPDSGMVFRYLGDCYAAENRQQDAVTAYKKAIRCNPQDAASMSALACLFDDQGENAEITLMFCRESVELSPENGLFRYRLGRLYSKLNRLEEALESYKTAQRCGHDARKDIQDLEDRLADKSS